jgi:ABC-2 type transport system ATP-binding protein
MEVAIHITDLVKRYKNADKNSLDHIDLAVHQGEKFGIFGPNGAGKTTLISVLCGILEPTSGKVSYHFDSRDLAIRELLPHVGFVPQDFAFYPELTPMQNLKYFGALYGISSTILAARIDRLLEQVGLNHVKDKKVSTFSGGMKRRINLAIGLINQPKLLFLDEPTVGVDVQSKVAIVSLLEEINRDGTTIIYTSHHLKEAEDFCDRIALIDEGKIIAIDTLEQLLQANHVSNLEDLLIRLTGKHLRD